MRPALAFFLITALVRTCTTPTPVAPVPVLPTASPTITRPPTVTPTVTSTGPASPPVSCEDWQSWPVVPGVSEAMRALYRRGQEQGNNAHAFSKIGDGEISTAWFFTAFDLGEDHYELGAYQSLAGLLDHFSGSFARIGVAARRGFNAQRILDPALGDPAVCQSGESPLACELRLHRPAFAILSLGTNQVWAPEEFERGMREIMDLLLSRNVVPILSTKGDNLEGDHRINRTIACLALEHDVPLWNFWSAIQPLPNHGLQADLEHLTYGTTDFGDERAMQTAWTARNLTGLQALDAVWRAAAQP